MSRRQQRSRRPSLPVPGRNKEQPKGPTTRRCFLSLINQNPLKKKRETHCLSHKLKPRSTFLYHHTEYRQAEPGRPEETGRSQEEVAPNSGPRGLVQNPHPRKRRGTARRTGFASRLVAPGRRSPHTDKGPQKNETKATLCCGALAVRTKHTSTFSS